MISLVTTFVLAFLIALAAQRLEGTASLIGPELSTFPERVVGSACASAFSRLTRRLLALRGPHTRTAIKSWHAYPKASAITSIAAPVASGWSVRRVGFAPTG